jgi:hypothetical protein
MGDSEESEAEGIRSWSSHRRWLPECRAEVDAENRCMNGLRPGRFSHVNRAVPAHVQEARPNHDTPYLYLGRAGPFGPS